MQSKTTSQSYYQRFPVLSFLGFFLCFILFPAGLLNLGLDQLLKTKEENQRKQLQTQMNQALSTIEKYSDNEFFSHFLLLNINNQLLRARDPAATFAKLKAILQKRYPDSFEFIYWNGHGKQIKDLSDEKSYGYIIKRTWQVLKKSSAVLANWDEEAEDVTMGNLNEIDREMKILRNFLGKLLVTYQLRYPWLSGRLGKPLQTAPPGPRSRIWYRINKHFGFLCFINDSFIQSRAGTDYAINQLKKKFPEFKTHVSDFPATVAGFYPKAEEKIAANLIQALSRFENLSYEKIEKFDETLISCHIINQTQRALCYCPSSLITSADKARFHYLTGALKILLPLLFIVSVWFKTRQNSFVSIRLKMVIIFLYAGGMPMLIMGSIGVEYLEQKKQQLIYQEQSRGINVLYKVDQSFKRFLDDHSQYLRNLVEKKNRRLGQEVLKKESLQKLRREIMQNSNPESIQLYNERGQNLVKDNDKTIFSDYTITSQLAIEMLHAANNVGQTPGNTMISAAQKVTVDSVARKKRIEYVGLGAHELYHYFDLLGEPWKYKSLGILQLFWRIENLQKNFFERFFREKMAGNLNSSGNLCAYYPDQDTVFTDLADIDSIKSLGQQAFLNQVIRQNEIKLSSGDYTIVGLRGLNLNKISILFLLPLNRINQAISKIQWQLAAAAITFSLLALLMFRFLARQFLEPVNEIETAIRSIDRRDFTYRLKINASKEFFALGQTFNNTLETLKDLETAKIVQENLLPAQQFKLGDYELHAFSQPYSKIGGDYYDFFAASEHDLTVFIGDVSGHGISAALIMAMAKATVIFEKNNFSGLENMIIALDQMIFSNRKSGTREYMTGLGINLDTKTGNLLLINRGHCLPVIIDGPGKIARHVKSGGLPLGYNLSTRNQIIETSLQPGETLCLYTDGMVEAQNTQHQSLGYEGLAQLFIECWKDNPEEFLNRIRQQHLAWSPIPEDDLTTILIRRNN